MKAYVLGSLLLILLSAPWAFIGSDPSLVVLGYPLWAVWCVAAAFLYAIFVAFSMAKIWRREVDAERNAGRE